MSVQPWYRQFWPWFVVSIPAATVVAGVFTVWLALQGQDSLAVHADKGIDVATEHNRRAERFAASNNIVADVRIDPESGAVTVSMAPQANIQADARLTLSLIHPTLALNDATIELRPAIPAADGNAVWAGHFNAIKPGRRYAVLSDGTVWRISGEWQGEPVVRLRAPPDGQS